MEEVPTLSDDILELGRRLVGRPAFLVGCARSGTSILGEALSAHPDVAYVFEASALWNSIVPKKDGSSQDDHRLTAVDGTPDVAAQVYEALAAQKEKLEGSLLLEKNPKHVLRIPFLRALFPEARFLHLIRDGRDAVASLMFRNRGEHWGHLKVPGWQKLLERYRDENHMRCAYQWLQAVSSARSDAAALAEGQYQEFFYENLVREPHATLREALAFLRLDTAPAVADFAEKIQNDTRGSYHAKKQVRHYVENHRQRVGRYKENLSADEIHAVESVCGELLRELGYEVGT